MFANLPTGQQTIDMRCKLSHCNMYDGNTGLSAKYFYKTIDIQIKNWIPACAGMTGHREALEPRFQNII
jgi:hypothetical protein